MIGDDDKLVEVFRIIDRVAPRDTSVLIRGENGTGKELIARAIHNRSNRKDRPFIAVNCGAIPPTLVESELFGHEKGAFTGADRTTKGKFELANGGTLFLDEVGDMPLDMQVKILRALQERCRDCAQPMDDGVIVHSPLLTLEGYSTLPDKSR